MGVETHVADVESHEVCFRSGDDTVEEDFVSGETYCFGSDVSKII